MALIISGGTAFITGAAQGIGKATAFSLAKYGAEKVVISDILMDMLEETAKELREACPTVQVLAVKCDVRREEDVKAAHEAAVKFGNGRLDYAVNNAGFEIMGKMTHEYDEAFFDDHMQVDLYGVWRCHKEQIKHMLNQEDRGPREGRGRIINISSAHGLLGALPEDYNTPYIVAKHGVSGLTRTDGNNYGPRGIRINAVCPGGVMTAMAKEALEQDTEGLLMEGMKKLPIGRFAQPEEIADVIAFLCSPLSSYMQSVCLPVDAGFYSM